MTAPPIPTGFWDRYPAIFHPNQPPVTLGNAGGLSGSSLWRVETPAGPLMLRAWPLSVLDFARVDQIHGWLDQARRFPWLAVPISDQHGSTWHKSGGRCWEIAPFLPGVADLGRPPSSVHLAAMFEALALVHNELGFIKLAGPSPGMQARSQELHRLMDGEIAQFRVVIATQGSGEVRFLAQEWLDRVSGLVPGVAQSVHAASPRVLDLQPVLRDVRPDHFLFEGDRLTGLVDFGAMDVDSIATDLARLLGETVGQDRAQRAIAFSAYKSVRPITDQERATIEDFDAANAVLGGARWVRWHYAEGRRFDDPTAVEQGLRRSIVRLEDWARRDQ